MVHALLPFMWRTPLKVETCAFGLTGDKRLVVVRFVEGRVKDVAARGRPGWVGVFWLHLNNTERAQNCTKWLHRAAAFLQERVFEPDRWGSLCRYDRVD